MSDQTKRRIVQIYIADPNEYIPLEKALLYKSPEPFLTDLTDQELFYGLELKDMLAKHNEMRVNQVDKKASAGQTVYTHLEPARMRDLTMTVLTLVSF